jgi:hypothetical protein
MDDGAKNAAWLHEQIRLEFLEDSCNFLELCDLVLLPATPCCHLSSMFCVTVSPNPYFLMAAAVPEYGAEGAVCCAYGATVPCIPAC